MESEANIEKLVRRAGRRPPLPDDVRARMEETFRSEMAATSRRRKSRTVFLMSGVAASFLVALLVLLQPAEPVRRVDVASVLKSNGETRWQFEDATGPVRAGNIVRVDDVISTSTGLIAIQPSGTSLNVRLGPNTTIRVIDPNTIELAEGSIYADSGGSEVSSAFAIKAGQLLVRHIGTQYLVNKDSNHISVAVREGSVLLNIAGSKSLQSDASQSEGQLTTFNPNYQHKSEKIERFGPLWDWTHELAPDLNTDDMPTRDFLDWVSRQTGYTIHVRNIDMEGKVIRGSIDTTNVFTALDQAMLVSNYQYSIDPVTGSIIVEL